MTEPLPVWVVYSNPSDFPDKHVVRKWLIPGGATDDVVAVADLATARSSVPSHCTCIGRHPGDDRAIVEVWL